MGEVEDRVDEHALLDDVAAESPACSAAMATAARGPRPDHEDVFGRLHGPMIAVIPSGQGVGDDRPVPPGGVVLNLWPLVVRYHQVMPSSPVPRL